MPSFVSKVELKYQLEKMGINIIKGIIQGEKVEKKVDISSLYNKIGEFYKKNPNKRSEIDPVFIELAHKLGIEIPIIDKRDMFIVADENGKFVKSFVSCRDAEKFVSENPRFKYYNRTHPKCPKDLKDEFDEISGWKD